jgi:large subunit ribosomal protein L7/L12
MSLTHDQVVEYLSGLTPPDLDALLKALEDQWGVKVGAAVPQGPGPGPDKSKDTEPEQTEFTVVLKSGGASKIGVIKVVREITGLGLKDAKDLVDGAPKDVKAGINKTEAEDLMKKLKDAGAEVQLK